MGVMAGRTFHEGAGMPRLRLLFAAVAVTTIAGGGVVLAATGSNAASPPTCNAAQLVPHLETSQGGAGHLYDTWQLINVGASTCRTQGWVGAVNYGPDGRPLATTVTRVGGPARPILLGHGQHASWTFGYGNPAILGCRGEHAVAQLITPPSTPTPVLAHPGEAACNGATTATPLVFGG